MIQVTLKISGAAAVLIGVLGIAFGSIWAARTMELFASNAIGRVFESFVPFLPIFLIAFGALLLVKSRQ